MEYMEAAPEWSGGLITLSIGVPYTRGKSPICLTVLQDSSINLILIEKEILLIIQI